MRLIFIKIMSQKISDSFSMREGSANLQALEETKETIRLKGKQLDGKQAEKIKAEWNLIYLEHVQ